MVEPRIVVLAKTPNPQQSCWYAMHQDYSSAFVGDNLEVVPDESKAGEIVVKKCIKFGHYGVIEHPSITFACGHYDHSVIVQARTHRYASFDVQSQRYTSDGVVAVAEGKLDPEEVFYIRPAGSYTDRFGKKYRVKTSDIIEDRDRIIAACKDYKKRLDSNWSEEHLRMMLPQGIKQHFVVSFNIRSLMHFLDLRHKKNAQLETQQLSAAMLPHFVEWCPEIANWYIETRLNKGRLAP